MQVNQLRVFGLNICEASDTCPSAVVNIIIIIIIIRH